MASTVGGQPTQQRPRHRCPDSVQCAEVRVNGIVVRLSFHGDLTPVEAVAVFLRDLADVAALDAPAGALLRHIAQKFDHRTA